jgi:methyl-accepting chemotaxis protein-1 (serine sensor receptor)
LKLGTKPQRAFFIAVFLMLAGALFGVYELKESLNRYRTEVKGSNDSQFAFDEITIDFKEQVQEWKDTLLRGRDPGDRERYWSAFVEREHEVDIHTAALIASLPPGDSRTLLEQFSQEHQKLSVSYRKGLERFRSAGFDPVAGDAAVRGIDREPVRLLDQAGTKIAIYRASVAAVAGADGERAAIISLSAILLASAICFLVFLLIQDTTGTRAFAATAPEPLDDD